MEEGLKEYSVARVRVGDVLEGNVISVNEKELAVNVGYRSDGIVPVAELPDETTENYKPGDSIEVMIVGTDDGEGNLKLSVTRAYATVVWDEFADLLESQNTLEVLIKEAVKGGVVAKYKGARVFIPASQVSNTFVADLGEYVGKKLTVRMIEVDKAKHKAVASGRSVSAEKAKAERAEAFAKLKVGDEMEGTVARIEAYGAFIDLGGLDGLLHISNMSWKRIKHPSVLVKVGDKVRVEVIKLDEQKGNVSLKLTDIPENPWDSIEVRYKAGEIHVGKVARIQPFGAFINLEEDVDGLCHVSEISAERVEKPSDVLNIGDEVEVKILSVNRDDRKISLSIRAAKPGASDSARPAEVGEKEHRPSKEREAEEPIAEGLGIKPTTLADLFADKLKNLM